MKIAFTAKGTEWDSLMDPRFGRTEFIFIYNEDKNEVSYYNNSEAGNLAHGAGPQTAENLFELGPGILITGTGPGGNAATVLEKAGMIIYVGAGEMTVKEAYDAFKEGKLLKI